MGRHLVGRSRVRLRPRSQPDGRQLRDCQWRQPFRSDLEDFSSCDLILARPDYCSSKQYMKITFKGSHITDTDYFESRDREMGVPWCIIHAGAWHVLMPSPPIHPPSMVEARPVTDCEEQDGWRWRIELPGWHLPLYGRCLRPRRPPLPEPLTRAERTAVFYHAILREEQQRGSSFFGSIKPGMQIWATCPLWLVRGKMRKKR